MNPRVFYAFVSLICAAVLVSPAAASGTDTAWYGFCAKSRNTQCDKYPFTMNVDVTRTIKCGIDTLAKVGRIVHERHPRTGQWFISGNPEVVVAVQPGVDRPLPPRDMNHLRNKFLRCCTATKPSANIRGTKTCFSMRKMLVRETPKGDYIQSGHCLQKGYTCSSSNAVHEARSGFCGKELVGSTAYQIKSGDGRGGWRLDSREAAGKGISADKMRRYWEGFERCCGSPGGWESKKWSPAQDVANGLAFCLRTVDA